MLLRRHWLAIALLLPIGAGAQTAPRWVVGGEQDIATQLGRFHSVAVLPQLIVVLERDAPFIKVFDYSGRLVQSTGRAGGGPGEFRTPSSLTFDARQERLLRELREDATALRVSASFGEPRTDHPHGRHPLVRNRVSNGPLHCDERGNRIVAASSYLGEVQVFDAATRAQRTSLVPGFQRLTITVDNNSMTMAVPEAGFDALLDLIEWDGELHAVAERNAPAPGGPPVSLGFATAPIAARGPEQLSSRRHWRPLAQTAAGALCAVSDPAPTIALFAGGQCP